MKKSRRRLVACILVLGMLFTTVFGSVTYGALAEEEALAPEVEQEATEDETLESTAATSEETAQGYEAAGEEAQTEESEATKTSEQTGVLSSEDTEQAALEEQDSNQQETTDWEEETELTIKSTFQSQLTQAEEELPLYTYEATATAKGNYYIQIQDATTGEWRELTSSDTLYNGQAVRLVFEAGLENNVNDVTTFTISIPQSSGITISSGTTGTITRNSDVVGTYSVGMSDVTITLDSTTSFFTESDRTVGVSLEGVISAGDDVTKDGEQQTISFGTTSVTVPVYLSQNESSASASKGTSGSVYESNGTYYQTFTATISASNGTVTLKSLTDTLTNGWGGNQVTSAISDISVTSVYANNATTSISTGAISSLSDLNGKTLYAGQSVTIQYTMEIPYDVYSSGTTYVNVINVDYTTNRNTQTSTTGQTTASVTKPSIDKTGTLDTSSNPNKITWTITISLGDLDSGTNILNSLLSSISDTLGTGLYTNTSLSDTSVSLNASDFTYNSNAKTYTYSYDTYIDANQIDTIMGDTLDNSVTMTLTKLGEYTDTGYVTYTGTGATPTIAKTQTKAETGSAGTTVTWQVVLSDISDYSYLVLYDHVNYSDISTHSQSGTISVQVGSGTDTTVVTNGTVTNSTIISSYNIDSNGWESALVFQKAWLDSLSANDTITVTYTTTITDPQSAYKYYNYARARYGTSETSYKTTSEVNAYYLDASNLLTKSGSQVSGENAVTYTLKMDLSALTLESGKLITITDTLPAGLSYVSGSASLAVQNTWGYNYDGAWVDSKQMTLPTLSVSNSGNVYTFSVTSNDDLVTIWNQTTEYSSIYLVITFEAVVTDEAAFIERGTSVIYENTASATYNASSAGTAKDTTTLTPVNNLVDKGITYTQDTAPYAKYTIELNPNALTLNGGSTLTATDTLGDDLSFVDPASMSGTAKETYAITVVNASTGSAYTVEKKAASNTSGAVLYEISQNTLTFTNLPDATYLQITYWAYVPSNLDLASANVSNAFSVNGVSASDTESVTTVSMVSYTASGYASSETGDITLWKYWTDNSSQIALSGSVFALYKATYDKSTDSVTINENSKQTITMTSTSTMVISGLVKDQLYVLYETESASGYALNVEPYYFILKGSDYDTYIANGTLPGSSSSIKVDETFSNATSQTAKLAYENVKAGTLVLTKTISGGANQTDVEGSITFTVTWLTDSSGTAKNIEIGTYELGHSGSDYSFTYDSASSKWTLTLDKLAPGTYQITETAATIGTDLESTTYTVTTTNSTQNGTSKTASATLTADQTTTVAYANTYKTPTMQVTLKKTSGTSNLTGAEMAVYRDDGDGEYDSGDTLVKSFTSGTSDVKISLYEGTYFLVEVSAPAGYAYADPIKFVVPSSGSNITIGGYTQSDNTVTMSDTKLTFSLKKTDLTANTQISGAAFSIYEASDVDTNGNVVSGALAVTTWTSDGNPHDFGPELSAGKDYVLVETSAPQGYAYADNVYFSIASNGTVSVNSGASYVDPYYIVMDKPLSVSFQKTDANGALLSGAYISVYHASDIDSSGDVKSGATAVFSWSTDTHNPVDFGSYLNAGSSYVLVETDVPSGYRKADNIEFTVEKDGTVTVDSTYLSNGVIVMEDRVEEYGDLVITKTISGISLTDDKKKEITFTVYDHNKKTVDSYTLSDFTYDDASGVYTKKISNILTDTYTVTETSAAINGYTVSVTYTVDNQTKMSGASADVEVTKDTESTVAFVNTYEEATTEATTAATTETTGTSTETAISTTETSATTETDKTTEQQTEASTEDTTEHSTSDGEKKQPKTKDDTPLAGCMMLLVSAAGLIPVVFCYRKKKEEKTGNE